MRTWVKIVLVLSIIIGIIVSIVAGIYVMPDEYSITIVKELQDGKRYIPSIGHYILFWSAVFVVAALFVLLLVILFWRNSKKNLTLPNGDGKQITIQIEAIKSIISAKVKDTNYFSTFKSRVKITRNKKIRCKIKGDILSDVNITGKMKNLEKEIENILKEMFGADSELIKTNVTVKAKGKLSENKGTRVV